VTPPGVAYREPVAIILVMGVSGSGKTTVGAMLAGRLHWPYAEADDFHPPANVAKMAAGHPLTDADRWPWLHAIGAWIDDEIAQGRSGVVTCSALKKKYRDELRRPQVHIVYLKGDRDMIAARLAARHGHFFRADMLDSQFADLEEPGPDEPDVLVIDIGDTPKDIVDHIVARLGPELT
jgi:gluconokinase